MIALKTHAFVGGSTRSAREHADRNARGWARLERELFGGTEQSICKEEIILNQAVRLEDDQKTAEPQPTTDLAAALSRVQAIVRSRTLRIGLFDDEQDKGWGRVLRQMLFGEVTSRPGESVIGLPATDARFECVRSAGEAEGFATAIRAQRDTLLEQWVAAAKDERTIQRTATEVGAVFNQAQTTLQQARPNVAVPIGPAARSLESR